MAASRKVGKRVAIALAGVVVLVFVGSFIADRVILGQTFARVADTGPAFTPTEEYARAYDPEAVEFELDGKTLRGYVYHARDPRGLIVFRHGIGSNHAAYLALICAMVERGWNVFAYDAIGCGISDGDDVVGMAQSARDVAAAVSFARESGMAGGLPLVLWGHSWGGYGVAAAMDIVPDVDACVTMSGYDSPAGVIIQSAVGSMGALGYTQAPTLWLNNLLAFGADANRRATDGINRTQAPVLVVHGTDDPVVTFDGTGIIAHRDRITNPNVDYLVFDQEGRSGHNSYFYSAEANGYLAEMASERAELEERYPEGVPDGEMQALMERFDMWRGNQAAPDLIDEIEAFLCRAVGIEPVGAGGPQAVSGDSAPSGDVAGEPADADGQSHAS